MNETEFKQELKQRLQRELDNFIVEIDESLIYKVIIDENLQFKPDNPQKPKRGDYAFQTDLLIRKKDGLPFVVIETKYGGFSTHDVLIYSTKALKHKEIYPYLRYGLVVGGVDNIENKFFTHNVGFDFALAVRRFDDEKSLRELFNLIKTQIKNAESLLNVFKHRNKARKFSTEIAIEVV